MSENLTLFPRINRELAYKLDCSIREIKAYYADVYNGYIELKLEGNGDNNNSYTVSDDSGQWAPEKYRWKVEGIIDLHNLNSLFEDDGVAEENSILGIGIEWRSKTSKQRKTYKVDEIKWGQNEKSTPFSILLDRAALRGNVEFVVVIYLLKAVGELKDSCFAIEEGIVLGELYKFYLTIDGDGSYFTVLEKAAKGEPLWALECDWENPEESLFTESVRIVINNEHPAWKLSNDLEFKKQILKEIMASAMQIVISQLDSSEYDGSVEYEPGSVSSAINYLINKAEINTNSYESIALTIRKYLDRMIK